MKRTSKKTTDLTPSLLATELNTQPTSITRRINRADLGRFGINDPLPPEIVDFVLKRKPKTKTVLTPNKGAIPKTNTQTVEKQQTRKGGKVRPATESKILLVRVLQTNKIAIPLLAIPAAFGVGFFASHFIPLPFAIIEAAGFEAVYIGLATMRTVSDKKRKYVQRVSLAAVVVSIVYNTIAAAIHLQPGIIDTLNVWFVSAMHGVPLSLVAFLMVDLTIRQRN